MTPTVERTRVDSKDWGLGESSCLVGAGSSPLGVCRRIWRDTLGPNAGLRRLAIVYADQQIYEAGYKIDLGKMISKKRSL